MKQILRLGFIAGILFYAQAGMAQSAFWAFDENDNQIIIPPECDGQFDETRGGVFFPTVDELFEQGERLLLEKGERRVGATYCLTAAALQGHEMAQYRLAQLYNKGLLLPQNDLVAYKWAYLAALSGNRDAERLALVLEPFLNSEEIQTATQDIQSMLPDLLAKKKAALAEQEKALTEKQIELEKINAEIDDILGIEFKSDVLPGQIKMKAAAEQAKIEAELGSPMKQEVTKGLLPPVENIYSPNDHM